MKSEKDWYVKMVRNRHQWLKLTAKQAQAVWEMEKEEALVPSEIHQERFSFWEKSDRDYDRWKAILSPDQFKQWVAQEKKKVREHEEYLVADDKKNQREVEFHQAYIDWLQKTFLPQLHIEIGSNGVGLRKIQEDRLDYLCAEFQTYRRRRKSDSIVSHYRHCRRLQPIGLRLTLLLHELYTLLPNYDSFIYQADEGIRAVGRLLLERMKWSFGHQGEMLLKKFEPIKEQRNALRKKFFGAEPRKEGGYTVIERKTDLSPAEEAWMSYLLMDSAPKDIQDVLKNIQDK